MNIIREFFDFFYLAAKPLVFGLTKKDPERAHEIFASFCRMLGCFSLDKFVFDNDANRIKSSVCISNAAGFNKNAEIPPRVLHYLGFDRVVIGTVTLDSREGNPRPRVIRYPKTHSMVNWMGLPGEGALAVAERLVKYTGDVVPLTINFTATPDTKGDSIFEDLKTIIASFKDNPQVDRFELNISCPNTENWSGGHDARDEYQKELDVMLGVIDSFLPQGKELYLKISPDMDEAGADNVLSVADRHHVTGFTLTNSTTNHDPAFIVNSPGRGGASGDAVYYVSCRVQQSFREKMKKYSHPWKIIACGGISTPAKMQKRVFEGASEIQIYTPMIFSGTRLIREFRKYLKSTEL